jgi:uncharacterized protein (DUF1697 family)
LSSPPEPFTYLALLRGINVGGAKKVPMADLARVFTAAGFGRVETYIQSGNVVFTAGPGTPPFPSALLEDRIEKRFGFSVPVVLRTKEQLKRSISQNPYLEGDADLDTLHVLFLSDLPREALVRALDDRRSPPDTFAVRGQEIYLRLPNGVARTKLTNAYFDAKLKTIGTMRNWRTVTRILALMDTFP